MKNKQEKHFTYVDKASTSILYEKPSAHNPYLAEKQYLRGYDIESLTEKSDYIDVLYLMFKGELPTFIQKKLLQRLMIGLINPGPRYPGVRAAMTAGVSKTRHSNLLPIGLTVQSGKINGSEEVESSYNFILQNNKKPPDQIIDELKMDSFTNQGGDVRAAPGFGSLFGDIDIISTRLANYLLKMEGCGAHLQWGSQLANKLAPQKIGWLSSGLVAAVLADLDFGAREAAGMYQLMIAPAIICHGLEQTHKPITSMPFLKDEEYHYE